MIKEGNKFYLEKIDALRGLAILLVVTYHTWLNLFPGFEERKYEDGHLIINSINSFLVAYNPIGQGWIGVELFLVISGFLIHTIYLRSGVDFSWRNFFIKRFWRIYPPYLVTLVLIVIANKFIYGKLKLLDLASHALMIHNLSDKTIFSINPSFWSIALEVQLYAIYPVFLFLSKRIGIFRLIIGLMLLYIAIRTGSIILDFHSPSFNASVFSLWFVWGFGAFLAERIHSGRELFKNPFSWFIIFYVLFFLFRMVFVLQYFVIIPATLACVALTEMVLNANWKIVKSKVLITSGIVSYSMYLIHQPLIDYTFKYFGMNSILWKVVILSISYLLIFFISYISYQVFEKNSIYVGKLFLRK